jgi:hypothetical protein
MISALRSSVEAQVGSKVDGGVATVPHLAALYAEDLQDAFEYLGLIYIAEYPYWNGGMFYDSGAAYVGNGFGLCSDYTDPETCHNESHKPPRTPQVESVLSISYTKGLLASTWARMGIGFEYPSADIYAVADFGLGLDSRFDYANETSYWAKVRDTIITPVLKANRYIHRETKKVILHGDSVLEGRFRDVVEEVAKLVVPNITGIFSLDPTFSAAIGASEMAKRVYLEYNRTRHYT